MNYDAVAGDNPQEADECDVACQGEMTIELDKDDSYTMSSSLDSDTDLEQFAKA